MANARIVSCRSCGAQNRVRRSSASEAPRCGRCHKALPWIVESGDSDFDAEVAGAKAVLVDFWAPWCGPCKMVAPVLEELASEWAGRLKVVKVNVDRAPDLARRYRVQGIPMLMLFHHGKSVATQVGAQPKPALQALLQEHLS